MTGYRAAIGLDFGRDAVKLVRAERQRGGGGVYTHAAMLRLPGERSDIAPVVRRWLETLNLPESPCVLGLPGRSIILKSIEMEKGDPRTPSKAAGLEVQKLRKLTSEEIIHDVRELPPSSSGTRRVLLFVVRPDVLEATLALPVAQGLDVVDVTPSPVALFNLVQNEIPLQSGSPAVLLDIGHHSTELIIGDRQGIRFVRCFDIGAGRFVEALAADLRLSPAQANERFQQDPGILANPPPAVAETLKAWYGEVGLSLDLYRDRFNNGDDSPTNLLLAGGGALLTGLRVGLNERFNLAPLEFPTLQLPGEIADPRIYALAAGLALTGIGKTVSHVSLAPAAMKERVNRRKDRRYLAAAAVVLLIAVLTMVADSHFARNEEQRNREESERLDISRHQLRGRLEQVQRENRLLLDSLRPVYRALESRTAFLDIMKSLSEARRGSDWFVSISSQPPGLPGSPEASGSRTNGQAMAGFLVRGYTPDAGFYSVRAMIDRLRQNGRVINADLMDESALTVSDPLASHWSPLGAIPFALTIQTASPKLSALPSSESLVETVPGSPEGLANTIRSQELLTRDLLAAWSLIAGRFATFKTRDDLFSLSPQSDVSFIDFRVALEETRRKLSGAAQHLGISIPSDLGLGESAIKDKEVRTLLFQLGAIHKWVETALACKVTCISSLEPFEPVLLSIGNQVTLAQYPLRVNFTGGYSAVMRLLGELGKERHFMVIRQVSLTRPDRGKPDLLEVSLEVAALDFPAPPDASTFTALVKQP
jgi:Tfp pilus assembly PilM family ATPase